MVEACELCQQPAELCRSHVIPEWAYEGAYDHKHKYVAFDVLNQKKGKPQQKGERENLLCKTCETVFSVWENYAKGVWHQTTGQWRHLDGGGLWGTDLDYQKLRLFLLSVLWRFDVAMGDIGENVLLGPHSEKIRLMLLEKVAPDPTVYPCMMMRVLEGEQWKRVGLRWPIKGRWDGQRAYSAAFRGIGLLYIVGKRRLKPEQQRGCISAEGNLVMGTSQAAGWSGHMGKLRICWPPESAIQNRESIQLRKL